ncbi:uncharacterized protein MELLADRAFT_89656 [Melampsora larici-populina 98AG31]|uniref:Uncharacterized protein n=1 Tax=Melampsora larici-populina (strain 98AG31 / pathotype 3-4-7) TaxID=747676 RepID=F4RU50_MELLP|nr:uncharacterized protein MELLADRAFT_89656 [Melampsora larici-populina 98AG31]EGG04114.1 hypothetical protein MELLADRAFT_89656 [Melampsora larici-populina 98AG31]
MLRPSHLAVPTSSSGNLGVPPSTPAREIRTLRTRSPQQPSPGFVLTGSDSRHRITREGTNPSCPTSPTEELPNPTGSGQKRIREEDDANEPEASTSKKKKSKTKATKDKTAPSVVDVDQDSSGDEVTEHRPGQSKDVQELLKYYGKPKHYKKEVCIFI